MSEQQEPPHAGIPPAAPGAALAGLRVLELGTLIAGPFAGRLLADFGADVIKIEEPGQGDPLRTWGMMLPEGSLWSFVQNRGKRCVALDLHRPEDRRAVSRLAQEADVLIENFRPGRMEQWGLGPEQLAASAPGLVYVRISGFGQSGPLSGQPGFGSVAEAMGGMRYLTGPADSPPTPVGLSLGDSIAAMYAVFGALTALRARDRTGRGQVVDVALSEAVLSMLEAVLPEYGRFGAVRERTGNLAHNSAPTNAYLCGDGRWVVIGANADNLFAALMTLMGRADLRDDPSLASNLGRVARAAELDGVIAKWAAGRASDEVVVALRTAGVPAGPVNSIADIAAEEQFRERGMVLEVESRAGPILMPGVMPRLSETPGSVRWAGPAVGEHTAEVMEQLDLGLAQH
ncbi:CoA transferase [Candidatus Nephthysia bennettiae]|uniref:CaiB/BaiF CoA transferase family protein n=1 Tax=Candidatus Nephthysia bennettiae TaxID=3127016 RepID=UPI0030C6E008